jgi:cholesterol transport system auxiliary component
VAPIYNTNQIIYRDQSFKRDAYAYFKWRANPGDLVTHFLNRDIRTAGLFKAVLPFDSRSASSHMLEGTVDEFFEWDTEENWKAVLSISITLMVDTEPDISKRIIFQKSYGTTKACEQKHPKALAQSMSQAMAEISGKIIADIYSHLKGGI